MICTCVHGRCVKAVSQKNRNKKVKTGKHNISNCQNNSQFLSEQLDRLKYDLLNEEKLILLVAKSRKIENWRLEWEGIHEADIKN
jgi:hypothetical protein